MSTFPQPRILIITAAKDEGEYIEKTIRSLEQQTCRPARWVIVNDGSSDNTAQLADAAAEKHDWITVIHRPAGTQRRVGPGVVEAFYAGLDSQNLQNFDFVTKMDADIEIKPGYFENLMNRFAANPKLGTASGKCWVPVNGKLVYERTGNQFSHGVCKLFRRECFEAIGGFVREVMWDGIDCHRCRMLGWEAASYDEPELRIIHLRMMGSSFRSVYTGRRRWGRGQYFMGSHPLYMLGITFYRMLERPYVLGGLCLLAGYISSWVTQAKRYDDPDFRRYLHAWQFAELKRRIFSRTPFATRKEEPRYIDPESQKEVGSSPDAFINELMEANLMEAAAETPRETVLSR